MRPELERLRRIEQLLTGTEPAATWEQELRLDPTLAADAEAQRQLYQALHMAGQRQLRQELNIIHARLYGRRRAGWFSAVTAGVRTVLLRWPRFNSHG